MILRGEYNYLQFTKQRRKLRIGEAPSVGVHVISEVRMYSSQTLVCENIQRAEICG